MFAIIWQNPECNLSYIAKSLRDPNPGNGISTREIAEAVAKDYAGKGYEIVLYSEIESDRSYRSAWVHDKTDSPQKISVDIALARDISLVRVRANRDAKLAVIENGELKELTRKGLSLTKVNEKIQKLLDATESLKALDIAGDGIISVEEAAGLLLPLELIA